MKRHTSFAAAAVAALALASASPATAQSTFQNFICADGSRFTAAFLTQDPKQAHLQIDGKAVTLRKRFTLSGARYTGRGVTPTMTKKVRSFATASAGDGMLRGMNIGCEEGIA
jgi:membrane-bound inhibitor of C-type lysozyme